MNKRTPNPKLFAAMTMAALVIGGALVFWQNTALQEAQSMVNKLSNQIGDADGLKSHLENSRLNLVKGQQELQHLETGVSTAEFVPTLLQNLETTGRQCNLQITGVRPMVDKGSSKKKGDESSPETMSKRKPYVELQIEVKAAGMFPQLMEFLKKLEEFPKIVAVQSISVMPKIKTDGLTIDRLETTINLRVFVFPTPGQDDAQVPGGV